MKTSHACFAVIGASLTFIATQGCLVEAPLDETEEQIETVEEELMRSKRPRVGPSVQAPTEWLDCGDPGNAACIECKYPPGGPIGDGVACCLSSNCLIIPK